MSKPDQLIQPPLPNPPTETTDGNGLQPHAGVPAHAATGKEPPVPSGRMADGAPPLPLGFDGVADSILIPVPFKRRADDEAPGSAGFGFERRAS
ncbi:hypothetical protein, partial [Acrocarpospora phusangensis]|uniref:hypothetical protein n=1 Tax=Acrocarpospora phusangensis TaxID=1070424 RepID=UPI001950EB9F